MTVAKASPLLTFEEFLELKFDDENIYELIDGLVVPMSEPSGRHESIGSNLAFEFELEIRRLKLNLETHLKTLCKLAPRDGRRPDLLVVDKDVWRRNTKVEAALRDEAPELVLEVVSTNWQEDYQKKPLWYAAFAGGVPEYWIVDPLHAIERYPERKNPAIDVPTVSVGLLEAGKYKWREFTGYDQIESKLFPELSLTVEQVMAAGA
jgi:Uma2 family endonuclease